MMFPSSFAVLLAGLVLGLTALVAFAWGWRRNQFSGLDQQARVIFDADDLQLDRPWETPVQRAEREARQGPLIQPAPGEWGGSA
jgi:cbb3-type cytochrome oxidase maturation protein